MRESLTVVLPIYLENATRKQQKRMFACNLNQYRNMHFQTLNKMKKRFKDSIADQLVGHKVETPCQITYHIFPQRICDIMNIGAVVDKFFCDALVELGVIPDDNLNHIVSVTIVYAEKDGKNPRAVAVVSPIGPQE